MNEEFSLARPASGHSDMPLHRQAEPKEVQWKAVEGQWKAVEGQEEVQ